MIQPAIRNLYCVVVSAVLLMSWSCHKKSSASPPPPAQVTTAPPTESAPSAVTPRVPKPSKPAPLEPAPLPKTITAPNSFDLGEINFQLGNYRQAAQSFEAYLSANPKSKERDQALFHLGLSLALADDSSRDLRQAEAAFRRVIAEYPDSRFKNQAKFILELQDEIEKLRSDVKDRDEKIKRLSDELQKLKEIDMQRRPSRPPN